jgi:phosphoribosylformylglycinamidine cyclo-ligase
MYQVFNMGHRMEIYVAPRYAEAIMTIAQKYNLEARIIGGVKRAQGEKVTVKTEFGKFEY